jgi:tetratricopeptide (TPR) repeat protein
MKVMKSAAVLFAIAAIAATPPPEPPLSDTRLTVHTLVREDVFAGFLDNDMERFARAERNIDTLLAQRPDQRANLLAWKAGAALYRAVRAHEDNDGATFQRRFQEALDTFAEASGLEGSNDGVPAITGGSLALFADRLPAQHRADAWSRAYDAYTTLWRQQGAVVDKLPVHHRGELLAGLAQSAERTGRREEAQQHVDKMLALLKGTPYEKTASAWKADPASAAASNLTCKTCHAPGRLSSRLAALNQ